jgi:hypothetical protein
VRESLSDMRELLINFDTLGDPDRAELHSRHLDLIPAAYYALDGTTK